MKKRLFAAVLAAAVLAGLGTMPAKAACEDSARCVKTAKAMKVAARKRVAALSAKPMAAKSYKAKSVKSKSVKSKSVRSKSVKSKSVKTKYGKVGSTRVAKAKKITRKASKPVRLARLKPQRTTSTAALAIPAGTPHNNNVVQLIKSMAPSHGVPTWFALKIAKVESNYNPRARGRAGELGVFQMKCATAKGIGFSGNCSALLDPAVNVRWGLKHLSLAVSKSGGNLKLAASKHNGGLGRKTIVYGYVAKVF